MSSLALLTSRLMSTHHHANQPQSSCTGDQSWPTLFHGLAAFIFASKLTRFIRPCRYRRRQQSNNIGRALCALVHEGKEKGLLGRLYHLTIQPCEGLLMTWSKSSRGACPIRLQAHGMHCIPPVQVQFGSSTSKLPLLDEIHHTQACPWGETSLSEESTALVSSVDVRHCVTSCW